MPNRQQFCVRGCGRGRAGHRHSAEGPVAEPQEVASSIRAAEHRLHHDELLGPVQTGPVRWWRSRGSRDQRGTRRVCVGWWSRYSGYWHCQWMRGLRQSSFRRQRWHRGCRRIWGRWWECSRRRHQCRPVPECDFFRRHGFQQFRLRWIRRCGKSCRRRRRRGRRHRSRHRDRRGQHVCDHQRYHDLR